MFSFLKPKPKLKDLIPSDYIDIHSHVLPGIDDGSQNIEESKFLIESMIDLGFTKVTTTPHTKSNVWDNTRVIIESKKEEIHRTLPELSQKTALNAASEYYIDEEFVKLFKSEKLLTLKDDKYVLVEMSYLNAPLQLYDFLFELQLEGYKPVLAHPERYTFYHNKPKEYEKLKKAGCLFQMNLLSSVGYYGKDVALAADQLLKKDMFDFVGSDIHNKGHILAFENKILIKSQEQLQKAIENNAFFG
ncbi:histidinol phosphatase [Flavobacterium sp. NRK F10]|uniref:tyrosine-protein phosphatase n=1 Tax=Flavobacterium sp. NRK F10 TaxID=2954931 RepID=UPI0020908D14|nr:CpsB/CapC family capsule biosynthesis tyrosine phosphatase [Flavobacterium sp. NRK F10]MCO6174198.1 histidinol phosphatase [Flavobacterium sp. NRK F10]